MKPAIPHVAIHLVMRVLWVVAISAAGLGDTPHLCAAAGTNRPPARSSTDRYLLIVDTSSAMERNAENTQKAVTQLFSTGIVGQARPGDTIGLWTFSDELKTGVFPLQRWTPQARQKLTAAAGDFMAKIQYEKKSRFEKVVEPLTSVVKDSEKITVIILTDGTGKISGTPFDEEINKSYRLNYSGQRKQRMPFITVLRAKSGEFIGWRVNTPPFRPEFPDFPVEPKAAEPPVEITESKPEPPTVAKPEPIAETKAEPHPPVTPSLIVVGETPAAAPATPTNPATVVTAPTTVAAVPASPDSPVQAKPDVQPAQLETTSSQPAVSTEPPVAPKPTEPPQRVPQPAPEPVVKPPSTTASHITQDSPPAGESPSVEPTPAEPPAGLTEPPSEVAAVQTAVATPGESLFNRTNLLIAGGVLLVGAFVVFYLLMRRTARPEEKVSLITRSMDRDEHNP